MARLSWRHDVTEANSHRRAMLRAVPVLAAGIGMFAAGCSVAQASIKTAQGHGQA
jgi:hypothetical protein